LFLWVCGGGGGGGGWGGVRGCVGFFCGGGLKKNLRPQKISHSRFTKKRCGMRIDSERLRGSLRRELNVQKTNTGKRSERGGPRNERKVKKKKDR